MDRSRRTSIRRSKPLGTPAASDSTSPLSATDVSFDQHRLSTSPVMAHTNTPQTAPPQHRSTKPVPAFSTPTSSRSPNLRRRSRTFETLGIGDDDAVAGAGATAAVAGGPGTTPGAGGDEDGAPRKGGHSLRKRARVDYSFLEHAEEDPSAANSTSTPRSKKRRVDSMHESEDLHATDLKRRGASVGADTPSSRRRNPSRKALDSRAYMGGFDEDENNVQDTIEVGVSLPGLDGSEMHDSSQSSADSPVQEAKTPHHPLDNYMSHYNHYDTRTPANSATVSSASNPSYPATSDDNVFGGSLHEKQESPSLPDQQLKEELSKVQSRDMAIPATQPPEVNLANSEHASVDAAADAPAIATNAVTSHVLSKSDGLAASTYDAQFSSMAVKEEAADEVFDDVAQPSNQLLEEERHGEERAASPVPVHQNGVNGTAEADHQESSKEDIGADVSPSKLDAQDSKVDQPSDEAQADSVHPETPASAQVQSGESAKALEKPDASVVEEAAVPSTPKPLEEPGETMKTDQLQDGQKPVSSNAIQDTKPPKPIRSSSDPWAHLTPYIEGEFVSYPEKKAPSDDEGNEEDQTPDDKDTEKEANDIEPMVEDNDDIPEVTVQEAATPTVNTPTRGSPVPDSLDPTTFNSPVPAAEEAEDADDSESQEPLEEQRYYRYRKVRDADDFISAIENCEDMSTADLYQILDVINGSMIQWQNEYNGLGRLVDDYENSLRRRVADTKYESRTRNLHQHGVNWHEPEFVVKGYKAKEKEVMSETRYLQSQDRIMAAVYGFEYDPHPSKIGRQNPESQQTGIMTRGRSLRNQPRQTAKATEADEVMGKRQRKPVQLFDPATQDVSRSSTPVPTRGRRRRNAANGDADETQSNAAANGDYNSEAETSTPRRRRRGPRARTMFSGVVDESAQASSQESQAALEPPKSGRRGRGRQSFKNEDMLSDRMVDEDVKADQPKRHMLTLKIPKGKNFSEHSSEITDNGDSRPSTASSDSTSHTAESSYSFRPKRQKRFRDDPEDGETTPAQQPPRKRGKRSNVPRSTDGAAQPPTGVFSPVGSKVKEDRKAQKIKFIRPTQESRVGTPGSVATTGDGDEPAKDYKSMTKSEKMSASMKSRWANGNMAGAVEKRKATLAAKKAAQAAADQKLGVSPQAPKPPKIKVRKEAPPQAMQQDPQVQFHQHQPPQQQLQHQQEHQPPPHQQLHQQPPSGFVNHMPGMGTFHYPH